MSLKDWNDPLIDALIEAYLINEKEIIDLFDRNTEITRKLREGGVKLKFLEE
ncbi:hypothetical protein LCGC14_1160940 [marine sediment metagenome]|uniref:Uncharacterized protein n=1 Tax=marine sediment metagenome TaxID=412755 RepID=A0A0F9PAX8_9ZZZZ